MAWSTSEIAELAGTTVKAVRHYHKIGLLEEPERTANNYKQYDVSHLVRLLQITRLKDLDVPLAQIALMEQAEAEPEQTLRLLDADLAATIERLTQIRAELELIFQHQSSSDMPTGFGPVPPNFSEADRALILIYSRVLEQNEMQDLFRMLIDMGRNPIHAEFNSLTDDADEATRQSLAERYTFQYRAITNEYPWLRNPGSRAPRGATFAANTIGQAVRELYNTAQLDALQRVSDLMENDDGQGLI